MTEQTAETIGHTVREPADEPTGKPTAAKESEPPAADEASCFPWIACKQRGKQTGLGSPQPLVRCRCRPARAVARGRLHLSLADRQLPFFLAGRQPPFSLADRQLLPSRRQGACDDPHFVTIEAYNTLKSIILVWTPGSTCNAIAAAVTTDRVPLPASATSICQFPTARSADPHRMKRVAALGA